MPETEQNSIDHPPAKTLWWQTVGWRCLLLVIITVLAYLPALQNDFIWDDDDHFTQNPAMESVDGLRQIWSSLAVSRYYPLTLTNFWIQRQLWDLNPMPYHLVNVLLHAFSGLLLFLIMQRLQVRAPWWVAAFWLLHPVNVESVAWATELKNVQSGVFFFAAILCYLRFEQEKHRHWYAWSLVFGLGAVLSKPSTVVLPVVLLLGVWWLRRGWRWVDVARTAPFFAMSLGMSVLTVLEQQRHITASGSDEWKLGIAERFVVAGKNLWFYADKVVLPFDLAFIYPRWNVESLKVGSWLPLVAAMVVGLVLLARRRQPWAQAGLFGFGFFTVALSPVLGFFGVYFFRYSFVADHFQYLACIGIIALIVGSGSTIRHQTGRLGTVASATILLLFGVITWSHTYIFRNNEMLWRDAVMKNPEAWIAHNNLGNILLKQGKTEEAIEQYQITIQLKSDHAEAHSNLGNAMSSLGKTAQAIELYWKALNLKVNHPATLNNLALILATSPDTNLRDGPAAVELAERACRLALHTDPRPHVTLSAAYAEIGRFNEAIKTAEHAASLARKQSNTELDANIKKYIEGYRQGRPYRQEKVTDTSP
jgi:hypothetical protein